MSMSCPMCNSKAECRDTRRMDGYTRRRYHCNADDTHRWTTVELVVPSTERREITVNEVIDAIMGGVDLANKLTELRKRLTEIVRGI